MQSMGLNTIRRKFLDFFERHNHLVHPSFPLVPQTDKTLLLINAGMVPLKDYFTGVLEPPSKRLATCQKCIRTNDIENVGITSRHASFFEMLGNFSFGDYFKHEAIKLAWEFITVDLGIEKEHLWVTVYLEDDEAYDIWHNQEHVPKDRIVRLGKEDNFWEIGMGAGPCGPCSEIYYDRGEAYGCGCDECKPGCDCDRFVEFWNLVFTQFEQTPEGEYLPLEKPNIDTGMGLERIACLMQDVESIFDIDVMITIREHIVNIAKVEYGVDAKRDISIRKITDHIRAVVFLVTDGVLPNNEGRGYVLRRLLRRAARHGRLIGIKETFLYTIVETVVTIFGDAYPELIARQDYTKKVIKIEEERFAQTIDQGLSILEGYVDTLKQSDQRILSGDLAFKLYDTYGFPLDLTLEILNETNISVDEVGFNKAMEAQRNRARMSRDSSTLGWSGDLSADLSGLNTTFVGYDTKSSHAKVLAILDNGEKVSTISEESNVIIILDQTPFYAESGGQSGDVGTLSNDSVTLVVNDTQKNITGSYMHYCTLIEGELSVDDKIHAEVSREKRMSIARNHTATHLLHRALKDVLGDHVEQAGSLVKADRLRFDFSHFNAMSDEEVQRVESIVNDKIFNALEVTVEEMPIDQAKERGAMALFGEKYGDVVRVVTIGDYSVELCGGTHLTSAAEVGLFKILSEGGVASGVRRIEAITGQAVYTLINKQTRQLSDMAKHLKVNPEDVALKIESLVQENKDLNRKIEQSKQQAANASLKNIEENGRMIKEVNVVVGEFENQQADVLRNAADQLVSKDVATLVVLVNTTGEKVNFVTMANDSAVKKGVHCGNIVRELAKICGGGGGGRPNMAQAGGKDATKLKLALQQLDNLV